MIGGPPDGAKRLAAADRVARALLYEGYNLYPYRPTALKNRYRWTFGTLPPAGTREVREEGMSFFNQVECLVKAAAGAPLEVAVRFLQLVETPDAPAGATAWAQAEEREVRPSPRTLVAGASLDRFAFEGGLEGTVATRVALLEPGLFRVAVRVENLAPDGQGAVLLRSLHAAHTLIRVPGGEPISAQDPPEVWRVQSTRCQNLGLWPVLLGPGLVLAAPIILADHPEVAPESPGDLFDATEIDEILSLRIHTMTDEERQLAAGSDPRTRELVQRTLGMSGETLMSLHGRLRMAGPARHPLEGVELVGRQVRLRPRGQADALDVVLAGRQATVCEAERDHEGTLFLAVTIDEDPGVDLGIQGYPGHRFFYRLDEVELEGPA